MQERIERDDEDATENPQHEMPSQRVHQRVTRKEKTEAKHTQPHRSDRDQSEFDLVTGEFSRQRRAQADSNRDGCVQKTDLVVAEVEQIAAVHHDVQQVHRAQKPEIGNAQNSEQQSVIRADFTKVPPEFADKVPANSPLVAARRSV